MFCRGAEEVVGLYRRWVGRGQIARVQGPGRMARGGVGWRGVTRSACQEGGSLANGQHALKRQDDHRDSRQSAMCPRAWSPQRQARVKAGWGSKVHAASSLVLGNSDPGPGPGPRSRWHCTQGRTTHLSGVQDTAARLYVKYSWYRSPFKTPRGVENRLPGRTPGCGCACPPARYACGSHSRS